MELILLYIFLLGLVFGSFYNVCIYRIQSEESIVKGRSHCQSCQHELSFLDLVPVFSYLFLKGRCRYCHQKISLRYPMIELLTAILFVAVFTTFGITWDTLIYLIMISVLIMLSFVDFDTMLIRDRFILLLLGCGIALIALHPEQLYDSLIGSLIISVPLFILAYLTHGIGYGDVKLMAVSGLILGWQNIILAMILGAVFASLVALPQMLMGKKSGKDEMPLGPYLALGIVVSLFFGSSLIQWYLNLL